ncbi:MAG: aminotransferase class I/II-fold pyridoxal phosphate-dependent enzyme [Lachnospiraceae bacterium]|nr:aminotransferase class I/II-fold pyridoxal phosphate-dependent enzyme [Lachnospiraceae bacterium]
MNTLYNKLKHYDKSDYYGFHMPGHKRKLELFDNPFRIDITEIEGFDDLHHPQAHGVLVRAQERAAMLYGSQETHFLVNGSTAGILSAVLGCTSPGGSILISRNCHRSVYHGIALQNLRALYVYPQQEPNMWINGSILPEDVDTMLNKHPDIQAVLITSPTYDGICSDLEEIGRITHKRGIPLLVDQAHGAHFPFHAYFPADGICQGADVVIHSVHKTLPSLTQTALLHLNGNLVDRDKIRNYLSVFQTSSPSYVLMASLDSCMEFLQVHGQEAFDRQVTLLKEFHRECEDLQRIKVMNDQIRDGRLVWDVDVSRLLCWAKDTCWTGVELGERLREDYHLQMEMSTCTYTLGISSVSDTKEGFCRLKEALFQLDKRAEKGEVSRLEKAGSKILSGVSVDGPSWLPRLQASISIGKAFHRQKEIVSEKEALGRTAGAFVYVYPPGIPLVAPGEILTEEVLEYLSYWRSYGMEIQGIHEDGKICVLK